MAGARTNLTDPKYEQSRLEKLNDQLALVKDFVANHLLPVFDQLQTSTNRTRTCHCVIPVLSCHGSYRPVICLSSNTRSTRDLDLARQPQQVWTTFCQILQEYVEILGQQELRDGTNEVLADFSELLRQVLRRPSILRFRQR